MLSYLVQLRVVDPAGGADRRRPHARGRFGDRRSRPRGGRTGGEPAGERQFAELRLLLTGAEPVRGLQLLDELAATPALLPELEALRGVEQNPYHHLDVHGHTMEVLARLIEVEADLEAFVGAPSTDVRALLAEPLADELTRGDALRFAALFHDLGKPETRAVGEGGRSCSSATIAPVPALSASSASACVPAAVSPTTW